MKRNRFNTVKWTLLIMMLVLLNNRCIKIGEYYAGLHLQPDLPLEDFTPGLNVYGILKTGPSFDTLNHYFEVQRLLYVFELTDSIDVVDASIMLKRISADGVATDFPLYHTRNGIYLNPLLETGPGERWLYTCKADSFEVSSSCTIPDTPVLEGGIEHLSAHAVRFSLRPDTTAFMYWTYLIKDDQLFHQRFIPVKGEPVVFELNTEWEIEKGKTLLFIFAFDQNLEKYYTTSNVFFKPNAYRPLFTTVQGGYGTFGAVSSTMFIIE